MVGQSLSVWRIRKLCRSRPADSGKILRICFGPSVVDEASWREQNIQRTIPSRVQRKADVFLMLSQMRCCQGYRKSANAVLGRVRRGMYPDAVSGTYVLQHLIFVTDRAHCCTAQDYSIPARLGRAAFFFIPTRLSDLPITNTSAHISGPIHNKLSSCGLLSS